MVAERVVTIENRFLRAVFSAQTGNLVGLYPPREKRPLVTAFFAQYQLGEEVFSEDPKAKGARRFETVRVQAGRRAVESVARSPHVEITRCFELAPDYPLLEVFYTVHGLAEPLELTGPQFPHVRYASEFLSVVEGDERDLFFDGAELGRGRQLPPWRVFFRPGHRDGLIIAARSKRMMSHMQIQPRLENAVEFRPHLMCSYSSDYNMFNRPMTVSPATRYEVEFEIGPWQARSHRKLIRLAALDQPARVGHPPRLWRHPAARLDGKVFYAADLASARTASREFHPAKWLITDEGATHSPLALFANGGSRPPLLAFRPGLKGLHRIFLGVGTGSTGMLRLSRDPEARYRHCPGNGKYFLPFELHLGARQKPGEIDFGVADMTGQRVSVGKPPTRLVPGMLDYVRFVKLTAAEARRWRAQEAAAPRPPLSGFADTYDIGYMYADAEHPTPAPYRANVWAHRRAGFEKIFWRIDGECSDFPTRAGTLRPISCWAHNAYEPHAKAYSLMLRRHDLLKAAVAAARDYGIELWGWMRFNSYFSGVRSEFFKAHPEMTERSESGRPVSFKMCMAFPEARRHKIEILLEAAAYGLPGLSLGFLRHPPIFQYHPLLVEGYRKRYGRLPPRNIENRDFFQHLNTPPESDAEHERWYRYRAEFMTQFGRDLRAALNAKGMASVKISIWVRPRHCLFDGIDLDAWLDERLCDEVVAGPYSGDPQLLIPTTAWKRRVQSRVPLIGGISCSDPAEARAEIQRLVRSGYDGICTYESNDAVTHPQMLALYRGLRRAQ